MNDTPETKDASQEAQTNESGNATGMTPEQELALLKQKADTLGLKYSNNIKPETLRQKINDAMDGKKDADNGSGETGDNDSTKGKSIAQIHQEERERQSKDMMKLVRCQIYNLNPHKADLQGEIVTVANRFVGTVRKMIPFGEQTEGGFHIPYILYKELKGRKYQQIRPKKLENGQTIMESRDVPEYQIIELDPLTQEELDELRLNQEAAKRIGK